MRLILSLPKPIICNDQNAGGWLYFQVKLGSQNTGIAFVPLMAAQLMTATLKQENSRNFKQCDYVLDDVFGDASLTLKQLMVCNTVLDTALSTIVGLKLQLLLKGLEYQGQVFCL